MIDRYSTEEMKQIWSQQQRFHFMLQVEKTVAHIQGQLGLIPQEAAHAITKQGRFNVQEIQEIEAKTKHDVIAFVQNVSHYVGEYGRYVHFGLTSSDVLDTALSLQLKEAFDLLLKELKSLKKVFQKMIKKYTDYICVGRTHGIWAEPITFSLKLAGFYSELCRNEERILQARKNNLICKLSGAVGTYSSLSPKLELLVAKQLKLNPEVVATQVIPRDRLAECYWALSMLMTGYERLAVELRHLQRSEVAEVIEDFTQGQKGSSAMPHKQNPISAENLTGLARMARSFLLAGMENIVLWHERDISHSSVERVLLPDIFILAHYGTRRLKSLLDHLVVNKKNMLQNIQRSQGVIMSSHVLNYLIEKGLDRKKAYELIQSLSFKAKNEEIHLKDLLLQHSELKKVINVDELQLIFSGKKHLMYQKNILQRLKF